MTRLACVVLLALLTWASPTFAATPAEEAAAEALFQEGRRLRDAKNLDEACPKFEESNRLSPSAGALLSLGDCLEASDKLASSWGAFIEAGLVAKSKADPGREAEAGRRAALLAPRLAKLAIVVLPIARVPGFVVHGDGSAVGEAQWGMYLPANVGPHTIEASAPGYRPWSMTIRIDTNGSTATVKIPVLDKIEVATSKPGDGSAQPGDGSAQKTFGYAAIGVGGAAVIVGAITLGLDAAKNASLLKMCPMSRCAPSLQSDVDSYHTLGIVSSSSLIVGGALAATGLIVVLATPKVKPQAAVLPLVGPGYVGLAGRF